jgi:8-oxo-dGTP pyrophosphatase MutT (NUDIX family)
MSSKTPKMRSVQETSAGGVVIRGEPGHEQLAVIVPVRRASSGGRVLCLPKGHIDPGEDALQAALREVREEAGVVAELIDELGEVRYWYRRDGRSISKSVVFYLLRYVSGDVADHDDEVERARWIDLREAAAELSYEGERGVVARALAALGQPAPPGAAARPGDAIDGRARRGRRPGAAGRRDRRKDR